MMGSEIGLAGIDIAIIAMYMIGVFLLGSFFGKYVKNAGDFFIAGKALPFWAIGMSIVVSDIGAMDFVGVAGSAYTHGISVANFDWIGSMPAMVFAAFIFVPYFWRSGVFTIPEFLGRRYNAGVQVLHGTIWALFLFTMLSLMLWVTADQLMFTVLGWPIPFTICLMMFITGVYTFSGGLSAVVMVDVVQLIVMFVGGIALLVLSMWETGGWAEVQRKVAESEPKLVVAVESEDLFPAETLEQAFEAEGFDVTYIARKDRKLASEPDRFVLRVASINLDAETMDEPVTDINRVREEAAAHTSKTCWALSKRPPNSSRWSPTRATSASLLPHDTYKPLPVDRHHFRPGHCAGHRLHERQPGHCPAHAGRALGVACQGRHALRRLP